MPLQILHILCHKALKHVPETHRSAFDRAFERTMKLFSRFIWNYLKLMNSKSFCHLATSCLWEVGGSCTCVRETYREREREWQGESIREDCILLRTVSPMLKYSYSSNSHWEQRCWCVFAFPVLIATLITGLFFCWRWRGLVLGLSLFSLCCILLSLHYFVLFCFLPHQTAKLPCAGD